MLSLEKLQKSYATAQGSVTVLKGIDLYIAKGEFVSIMGPSGSGKSTLAAVLGCLTPPSKGKYTLDGVDVGSLGKNKVAALRNEKIGFIFQDFNLLEGMTAAENVALPLIYSGVSARERRARAIESLKKVNLGDRIDHLPKQLSGGQKQRVAIARALVTDPLLIFADEPTGALDSKNTVDVMVLLQSLNLQGHTIVQVTHATEDAAFSKRVIFIADGLIVKDEPVKDYDVASRAKAEAEASAASDPKRTGQICLWGVAAKINSEARQDVQAVRKLFRETKSLDSSIEAVRSLVKMKGTDYGQMLVKMSRHEHWSVRAELVKLVDVSVHDLAVGFFIAGLRDESAWVRFSSVQQIARLPRTMQTGFGTEDILKCLEDEDERVRAATVALVENWRDDKLLPRLSEIASKDQNPRVRSNAMEALRRYLGPSAETDIPIIQIFRESLSSPQHRVSSTAAVLIFPHSPNEALAVVRELKKSPRSLDRAAAAWALGLMPTPDVVGEELIGMVKTETDSVVVSQLIKALVAQTKLGFSFADQLDRIEGVTPKPQGLPQAG